MLWALDYFRYYHHGRQTLVLTDHGPLKWLMTTSNLGNALLARYALRLQAYMPFITIDYKPGRINSVPDTLSRLPVDMDSDKLEETDEVIIPDELYIHQLAVAERERFEEQSESEGEPQAWNRLLLDHCATSDFMEKVRAEQRAHPGMKAVYDFITDAPEASEIPPAVLEECEANQSKWRVADDILRRVVPVQARKNKAGIVTQPARAYTPIALPRTSALRTIILELMHDHPVAAHVGVTKMIAMLRPRFYWQGWQDDVRAHVDSCLLCQRYKAFRRVRPSTVMPIAAPEPFFLLAVDLIGPMPLSMGKSYALVCIDYFSCAPFVIPIPSKEPRHVAKAIVEEVVMRHSCPQHILSDRGSEFNNQVMEFIVEAMCGIKQRFTTPYHPACNGKVENLNKFIKRAMAILVEKFGRGWAHFCKSVAFAYFVSPLKQIGVSPFEILQVNNSLRCQK